MNNDFKYLLENCREESIIDGVFTFNTPDGWAGVKKKRAIDKGIKDGIIEPVTEEKRSYYRLCNSITDGDGSSCNSITDGNRVAELLKENADLKKVVDDLTRKVDGLQRAYESEHNGYLKWRDRYNDLKEENDRLEILLNR